MVCRVELRECSIYRVERGAAGAVRGRPWRGRSGARRAKARTAWGSWQPGDAQRLAGAAKVRRDGAGEGGACYGVRRQSYSRAAVTELAQAFECV